MPHVRDKEGSTPIQAVNLCSCGKRYWTYAPMLHPEQKLSGADAGKTLVSINWNGQDFSDVLQDADLYKPRFVAVRLP